MIIKNVYKRLTDSSVPLPVRFAQLANSGIEMGLSGPLNIAHVIEFPKCGGSWIRNMIRTYRGTRLFTGRALIGRNEVVMHHRRYRSRYKRPVVVVRDPRDLYVSFFYYETTYKGRNPNAAVFENFTLDESASVQDNFLGYLRSKLLYPSHPWFFYSQFLDDWLNRPGTCLVRYEDCLAQPAIELTRILRFLDEPIDLARIDEVVEETSFKAITSQKYDEEREAGQTDNSKFHRKGVAGDWTNHFNAQARELFEQIEGDSLRRLGYEDSADWVHRDVT